MRVKEKKAQKWCILKMCIEEKKQNKQEIFFFSAQEKK